MAKNSIRIRLKAYESRSLDAATKKIVDAANDFGSKKVIGPVPLPTEKQVITVLRAVHKYKDSREQFEIRTHKRLINRWSVRGYHRCIESFGIAKWRRYRNQTIVRSTKS